MSAKGSEIYGPAPSTAADREPTPAPAWVYLLPCTAAGPMIWPAA